MKTIIKYKLIFLVSVLFSFASCEDFLDVNENQNKVTEPTLSTLATSCIGKNASMHYSMTYYTDRYTQHITSVNELTTDQHNEFTMSGTWTSLYTGILADLDELVILATEEDAAHYLGMAQVLTAANIGAATDIWGAIPYSEALQGNENFTPAFDTHDEIYIEVFRLLDEGILNLKKTETRFNFNEINTNFDILNQGDLDKWIKTAYAYKARFLNHLSNTSSFDAQSVRDAVNNSYTAYAEDANFVYTEQDKSPYYNIVSRNSTGNVSMTFSDYFIQLLNDNIYQIGMIDPRLAIIADTVAYDKYGTLIPDFYNGVYTGYQSGGSVARDTDLDFTENCWHFGMLSTIQIMTYAEMQFILAEVEVNAGNKTAAYDAYINGLTANMEKLGVEALDITDYITATGVDATNIDIEQVMKEKYVAMFLQFEAWNDIRRYDYGMGNTTYKNFTMPIEHNVELFGEPIRRILYPLTEETRNSTNTEAAKGDDYGLLKRIGWNQ